MDVVNNPEDPAAGTRQVPFARELYIERDDFMEDPPKKFFRLAPGREVRLRNAYLVTCSRASSRTPPATIIELHCTYDPATRGGDAPDGRKVKATLHWVSAAHAVDAEVRLYDRLFSVEDPDGASRDGRDFTRLPQSGQPRGGARLQARAVARRRRARHPLSVRAPRLLLRRPRHAAGRPGLQPHRLAEGHLGEGRGPRGSPRVKHFLLMYEVAPDYLERRAAFRTLHLAKAWAASDRGELLLGGALADPPDGAVLLFQGDDRRVAEQFAETDPYVRQRPRAEVDGTGVDHGGRRRRRHPGASVTGMVARMWTGVAHAAHADAYLAHVSGPIFASLRALDGFVGGTVARRDVPAGVEFVVTTYWRSRDAIRAFAGDDIDVAVVHADARRALVAWDDAVRHYDVAFATPGLAGA